MRIYVGNIPYTTTEDDLRREFGAHGQVKSAAVVLDRETQRPRGFAFVEMATPNDAQRAISSMHGQPLGGRTLVVREAHARGTGRRDSYSNER